MNVRNLHLNVDFLGSSGVMLSPEQKSTLQAALTIVQHNENFSDMYFWGKILGLNKDYFIIQGTPKEPSAFERKTLYSQDCMNWGLLIPATEDMKQKAKVITGRFTGDPAYEFEKTIISVANREKETPEIRVEAEEDEEDEEEEEEEEDAESASIDLEHDFDQETVTLKEEDRMAAVIANIDADTALVPRGAYVLDPLGKIYKNRLFEGLSQFEASKLDYYFHFRKPSLVDHKTLIVRADLDRAIDFMDNISEDVPRGCWSIQQERGGGLVTIRSLYWVGYTFYHMPRTTEYGSAYVGTGEKNIDLPFML